MDFTRNINEVDLVFLDLETTGLNAVFGDSICEIGAIKVRSGKIIDKLNRLVNPGKPVSIESYNVHKISDEKLRAAPFFDELCEDVIKFLKGSVICAYNVKFDIGFIESHLKKIGRAPLNLPTIDILSMARDVLKLPRYNLDAVAGFFNVDCSRGFHRALIDADIAREVFFNLINIFKNKKIETLYEFISLYGWAEDIIKLRENKKIDLFKEAIDKNMNIKMRFFSTDNVLEEKVIIPLRIFQENRKFCLLYQAGKQGSSNIRINRIFKAEPF